MNKSFINGFLLAALLFSLFSNFTTRNSEAQPTMSATTGVFPFWTSGGWLGLFSSRDGMIYFYDDKLQNCITTVKVDRLGAPLVKQ